MKITIGPYVGQLINVESTKRKYRSRRGFSYDLSKESLKWYDKLVFTILRFADKVSHPINVLTDNRNRKVKIQIDHYDVWNADHTLALIIHPLLQRMQANKGGSPFVDPKDVPEHLRPTSNEGDGYTDNTHHQRWKWVIDELVWVFGTIAEESASSDEERTKHALLLFGKYYRSLWT